MERSELFAGLKKVIVEHAGVDPDKVTEEALLEDDLGLDSLDKIELGMALEEEFQLYPSVDLGTDDQLRAATRVKDFLDLLEAAVD